MNGGKQTAVGARSCWAGSCSGWHRDRVCSAISTCSIPVSGPRLSSGTRSPGLAVGAPVTFRGVRVGAVDSIKIEFDPQTAGRPDTRHGQTRARSGSAREARGRHSDTGHLDLPDLIARGLRAELILQSFVTGQSAIDLDFDPTSAPVLHAGHHQPAGDPNAPIHVAEGGGAAQSAPAARTGR